MGEPLTSLILTAVFAAIGFYVLYWVVRKAVAAGIRDASGDTAHTDERARPESFENN